MSTCFAILTGSLLYMFSCCEMGTSLLRGFLFTVARKVGTAKAFWRWRWPQRAGQGDQQAVGDLLPWLVPRWLSFWDVAQVIQAMSFGQSSPLGPAWVPRREARCSIETGLQSESARFRP